MRLLLLEGNRALGQSAAARLLDDGHLVEHVERLHDLPTLPYQTYDVLVVSSQLPDGSGLSWIASLRDRGVATAAVMLAEPHRGGDPFGAALSAGADDCLVRPVDLDALATHVRDVRLKAAGLSTARVTVGDVELDLRGRRAFRAGEHVPLTGREWNLVEALALRFDRIVPKSDLALLVQGLNASPTSAALEVHLSNVRRKLGRRLIRTVRASGYRMIG